MLLAYWVTSRVWWTYHTLASSKELRFESFTITSLNIIMIVKMIYNTKHQIERGAQPHGQHLVVVHIQVIGK